MPIYGTDSNHTFDMLQSNHSNLKKQKSKGVKNYDTGNNGKIHGRCNRGCI